MTTSSLANPPAAVRPRRAGRVLAVLCWLWLLGVGVVWWLLWTESDQWWVATLMMYGPRWIYAAPALVLAPAALLFRLRLVGLIAVGVFVVLGPVMGGCIPWQSFWLPSNPTAKLRVLTFNCHFHELKPVGLENFIAEVKPDIVFLQALSKRHLEILFDRRQWNLETKEDFCLATHFPILNTDTTRAAPFDHDLTILHYEVDGPMGPLHLFNLHLASPRDGIVAALRRQGDGGAELDANSTLRRDQAAAAIRWIRRFGEPFLIAGDFNTPPISTIYAEHWSAFGNAFSEAGWGWGYTHYSRHAAVRIDHILMSPGWRCRHCWVGPDLGSEHRPVIADLEWTRENQNVRQE